MLYRESALMVFGGHWASVDILYKRGLARALIQYSHIMGRYVKGSEGLCSALVMAVYDPWGDPIIRRLLNQEDIELHLLKEFISSEPHELLLLRIECLVNAHFEEAAIRLLRCSLHSVSAFSLNDEECDNGKDWKWPYMEWLLRLLFWKRRLNDIILETSSCSCHDGVRLIYRSFQSSMEDSEALTETLINIFLVRDLLFKSNYCCTSELMKLWCEFQAKKQKSVSEIQEAARKLLVGHASSSAQFYLFVDILWAKVNYPLMKDGKEVFLQHRHAANPNTSIVPESGGIQDNHIPPSSPAVVPDVPHSPAVVPSSGIKKYLLKENICKSEILWCLQAIATHRSLRSAEKDAKLFSQMFKDSEIAKGIHVERDKMAYFLIFGIAPFFKENFMKDWI
ncbi:hypothetical protein AVEN_178397-1 [Araneus ventricosus]|uniref:Uncharacterized protein n=1 Tax=Araneus ventricosus TaxID=182803 RepID=A0A4Y2BFT3_ARAVE|nr:hypothetical protein AVEN_178397-1 [Araneus ventricosus]